MATYLVGFGISQGEFLNNQKETVSYSNRLLRCVTDNAQDSLNFGFSGFEFKIKASDISKSLGVSDKDDAVDTALKNLYKKPIELIYAPVKNELTVIGIRPVYTK
ncbi:MAG: hypothetical protein NC177_03470 [Ruminococcus flavefaciens]|nr:hypothetical protein [Ruminococcus flavefaciens]